MNFIVLFFVYQNKLKLYYFLPKIRKLHYAIWLICVFFGVKFEFLGFFFFLVEKILKKVQNDWNYPYHYLPDEDGLRLKWHEWVGVRWMR